MAGLGLLLSALLSLCAAAAGLSQPTQRRPWGVGTRQIDEPDMGGRIMTRGQRQTQPAVLETAPSARRHHGSQWVLPSMAGEGTAASLLKGRARPSRRLQQLSTSPPPPLSPTPLQVSRRRRMPSSRQRLPSQTGCGDELAFRVWVKGAVRCIFRNVFPPWGPAWPRNYLQHPACPLLPAPCSPPPRPVALEPAPVPRPAQVFIQVPSAGVDPREPCTPYSDALVAELNASGLAYSGLDCQVKSCSVYYSLTRRHS